MRGVVCACVCIPSWAGAWASAAVARRLSGQIALITHRFGRRSNPSLAEFTQETDNYDGIMYETMCTSCSLVMAASGADLAVLDVVNRFLKNRSYRKKQMCGTAITMSPW